MATSKKKPGVAALGRELQLKQHVPATSEKDTVGAMRTRVKRGTPEFAAFVKNDNPDIVFKDEEGTGADRMMTKRLGAKLDALAALVKQEWPGKKLRVTEAWDEDMEHGSRGAFSNSIHYEGRAADMTVSDRDSGKLGRLARLAVDAGFDWVLYENRAHVHASVVRDGASASKTAPTDQRHKHEVPARPGATAPKKAATDEPPILSTTDWGASPPRRSSGSSPAEGVVLHHMVFPNRPVPADAHEERAKAIATARRCQSQHLAQKWSDTGQHWTVSRGGLILEGRTGTLAAARGGRVVHGAHATNSHANKTYWGIECEGTYHEQWLMPDVQWQALVRLVRWLCSVGGFEASLTTITPHKHWKSTQCPGLIAEKIPELIAAIGEVPKAAAKPTTGATTSGGADLPSPEAPASPPVASAGELVLGQKVPATSEAKAVGAFRKKIARGTPEFATFVKSDNPAVIYVRDEGTDDDQWMTKRCSDKLDALARLVRQEWPELSVRVTDAWDEGEGHAATSRHYEGRALDLTVGKSAGHSDRAKLGRLARLAVDAGFDWVWYENDKHVHASVVRDSAATTPAAKDQRHQHRIAERPAAPTETDDDLRKRPIPPDPPFPGDARSEREAFARALHDQLKVWIAHKGITGLDSESLVAQWMMETNWGRSKITRATRNWGNIKGEGPAGSESFVVPEYIGGRWVKEPAKFRKYNDNPEAFEDYFKFVLHGKRYKAAVGKKGRAYFQALHDAGYATDPEYADKMVKAQRQIFGSSSSASSGGSSGSTGAGSTGTRTLKLTSPRMRGDDVRRVQTAVGVPVDGIYGPVTTEAVRAYQQQQGLEADGVVGPKTAAALERTPAATTTTTPTTTSKTTGETQQTHKQALPARPGAPASTSDASKGGTLRERMVAIALAEYGKWNEGTTKERNPHILPLLQRYWREGAGQSFSLEQLADAGFQKTWPWSAAFVSWVVRQAGGGSDFHYAASHAAYTKAAKTRREAGGAGTFNAYRVSEVAPRPGDIIVKGRAGSGATYDTIQTGMATHGDIVISVSPGQLVSIGGNLGNSVQKRTVKLDETGHLTGSGHFAVIQVGDGEAVPDAPEKPATTSTTKASSTKPSSTSGRRSDKTTIDEWWRIQSELF
ncbi:MAG: DUF2272 domain-containing protein [Polyangiaceae bacterium]